jgi:predicted Zn-dependent peptidase
MFAFKKYVKPENGISSFSIIFDGAGLFENKNTFGYSHIIEHLVAAKLKEYENKFNEVGVSYNAYTSNDQVVYYIFGLDEGVCKYKKLLTKIVSEGLNDVTEEQLENEKSIVLREYESRLYRPLLAHLEYLGRKVFNTVSPIGTQKSITDATLCSIKDFFKRQFKYPDAVIDISSKDNSEKILRNFYSSIEFKDDYCPCLRFKMNDSNKSSDIDKSDICPSYFNDTTSIIAAFPVKDIQLPYMQLTASILGGGLASPLYNEIRIKNNLAYSIYTSVYQTAYDFGIFIVGFEIKSSELEKAKNILSKILSDPKKYVKFNRFKSVYNGVKAQDKINHINIASNPEIFINWDDSVEQLVADNECNEAFYKETINVFKKVIKNIDKHIYTYNGNPKYKL